MVNPYTTENAPTMPAISPLHRAPSLPADEARPVRTEQPEAFGDYNPYAMRVPMGAHSDAFDSFDDVMCNFSIAMGDY